MNGYIPVFNEQQNCWNVVTPSGVMLAWTNLEWRSAAILHGVDSITSDDDGNMRITVCFTTKSEAEFGIAVYILYLSHLAQVRELRAEMKALGNV